LLSKEEVLLSDLHNVGGRPVEDQCRGEQKPPDPEQEGHHPGEHLLLGIGGRRGPLHLALLVERGPDHGHR
jgi:hypothetical protein